MLIDEIELYKSKIQSKIFSLSQEMGSVALIGGEIENRCLLELFSFLSILSFSETTNDAKEELLSYIIWKYELSEVDILPFTFPNVDYVSDGFNSALYYTKTEVDALLVGLDIEQVFPIGTPNVNVAVGGWNIGYVLSGVPVIDALTDLGIQFINPSTVLSFVSPTVANVERGTVLSSININRSRTLGSATFFSGLYTQPNVSNVTDNAGAPNARSFTGISISANNTSNIVGGIPVHVLTLTTTYKRLPGDVAIDASLTETDFLNINFISPVYYGVLSLANSATPALIQALSRASLSNNRARNGLGFTPTLSEGRLIYAYPSRLGVLTSITDSFGNILTGAFDYSVIPNFSFADTSVEDYRVYVYKTDVSPGSVTFNFS